MLRIRRLRSITCFIALALLPACSGADTNGDWSGTIETLSGGAVRVTNPRAGVWEGGTPWQLRQGLVLGEEDGEGPAVFASISAIEADDAGNIYVLDRQANDLKIFGADGDHIRPSAARVKGRASTPRRTDWRGSPRTHSSSSTSRATATAC